jgi:hypothetical protein
MMNQAKPASLRQITVLKPHRFKRKFTFIEQDQSVGEMIFNGYFSLSNKSALLGEDWAITRSGFWRNIFEFKAGQRPFSKFVVKPAFNGKLDWTAADGKRYQFRRIKWWKQGWGWYDENGEALMEIRPDRSFTRKQAYIDIFKAGPADLVPMILTGWLGLLIQQTRAAAAST